MNDPMKSAAQARREMDDFFADYEYRLKSLKETNKRIMEAKQIKENENGTKTR